MSNPLKEIGDSGHNDHAWERTKQTLDDGFYYYYLICRECHTIRFPGTQLQRLQDYSKENLFLFVQDWALLLLYAGHEYIAGITHYQKMLFLIFYEFAPNSTFLLKTLDSMDISMVLIQTG